MNRLLLPLLLAAGCSSGSADFSQDPGGDTAGEFPPGTLRVDVTPGTDLGASAQSFRVAAGNYTDQLYQLKSDVTVTGTVSGTSYTSWGLGPPTTSGPVAATLTATRLNYLQGGGAHAAVDDTTGTAPFSMTLCRDSSYVIVVVPDDPSVSAMQVNPPVDVTMPNWDLQLDPGVPVYGHVRDGNGVGIGGVSLTLTRADVAATTAAFTTDAQGYFYTRAEPGYAYGLEVVSTSADGHAAIPAVTAELTPGQNGAEVDLDLGALETASVHGTVVDAAGAGVRDATVAVYSTSLADGSGSFTTSLVGQSDGQFSINLLPGDYTLVVTPPYETAGVGAPTSRELHVGAGGNDLGHVSLGGTTAFSGDVVGVGGERVSGASVTVQQIGYGEYAWNTTTDADGHWSIDALPAMSMKVMATPPDGTHGAATRIIQDGSQTSRIDLPAGTPVSGTVSFGGTAVGYALVQVRDWVTGEVIAQTLTSSDDGSFSVLVDPTLLLPDGGDTADTGGLDTGDTGGVDTGDTADTDTGGGGSDTTDTSGGTDTGDTSGGTDTGDTSGGTDTGDTSGTDSADTSGADTGADTAARPHPRPHPLPNRHGG